jgi:hypothetical protein
MIGFITGFVSGFLTGRSFLTRKKEEVHKPCLRPHYDFSEFRDLLYQAVKLRKEAYRLRKEATRARSHYPCPLRHIRCGQCQEEVPKSESCPCKDQ